MASEFIDTPRSQIEDLPDSVLKLAPIMVLVVAPDRRITQVSDCLATRLGYAPDDLIGLPLSAVLYAGSTAAPAGSAADADGQPRNLRTRDGRVLPMVLSTLPQTSKTGGVGPTILFLNDNIQYHQDARAATQKQVETLEAQQKAASADMRRLVHDLRSPLNAIGGFAQLLQSEGLPPGTLAHVEVIADAAQAALKRLEGDLAPATPAPAATSQRQPMVVADLVQALRDRWDTQLRARKMQMDFNLAPDLPAQIVADREGLEQLLDLLFVKTLCHPAPEQLSLSLSLVKTPDPVQLRIELWDRGPAGATTRLGGQDPASDIGQHSLAQCDALAQTMDARLTVYASVDHGTRYVVTLNTRNATPVVSPLRVTPAPQEPSVSDQTKTGLQVLVAEDNHVNAAMARRLLEDLGHAVTRVETGFEVVRACRDHTFDLIFMDLMMPGLGGIEAARMIREAQSGGHLTPIIACTGLDSDDAYARCRDVGMRDILRKPLDRRRLEDAIARATRAD